MSKTRHNAAFTPKAGSILDHQIKREAAFVAGVLVHKPSVPPIVSINRKIWEADRDIAILTDRGEDTRTLLVTRFNLIRMRDTLI